MVEVFSNHFMLIRNKCSFFLGLYQQARKHLLARCFRQDGAIQMFFGGTTAIPSLCAMFRLVWRFAHKALPKNIGFSVLSEHLLFIPTDTRREAGSGQISAGQNLLHAHLLSLVSSCNLQVIISHTLKLLTLVRFAKKISL